MNVHEVRLGFFVRGQNAIMEVTHAHEFMQTNHDLTG